MASLEEPPEQIVRICGHHRVRLFVGILEGACIRRRLWGIGIPGGKIGGLLDPTCSRVQILGFDKVSVSIEDLLNTFSEMSVYAEAVLSVVESGDGFLEIGRTEVFLDALKRIEQIGRPAGGKRLVTNTANMLLEGPNLGG